MAELKGYKRKLYFGIILIALGVVMNTSLNTSLGTVMLAIGGLFFIIGMRDKRREDEKKEEL